MNELIDRIKEQRPIEYQGERVITFAMMDELHQRPAGTAGRNFRRHRGKLLEGVHYWQIPVDEFRRLGIERQTGGSDPVVLSQRGYLMLVKSFRDPLAWKVQDLLVEHYFRSIEQLPSNHLIGVEVARGIREGLESGIPAAIEPVRQEMRDGFQEVHNRIDGLERRRPLSAATKRQHIETVIHFCANRCPCCEEVIIVDEFGVKTSELNWEHWLSPSKNRAHETWPTCRACNIRLRDDFKFRIEKEIRFKSFQQRREQSFYPLLPAFSDKIAQY